MLVVLTRPPPRAGPSFPTCWPYVASRILSAAPHLGVEPTAGLSVVPFGGQHAPLVGDLGQGRVVWCWPRLINRLVFFWLGSSLNHLVGS